MNKVEKEVLEWWTSGGKDAEGCKQQLRELAKVLHKFQTGKTLY